MKPAIIGLAVGIVVASRVALADAANGGSGRFDHYGMMDWGWGGWFMGPIMMLIVLALLVGAIVVVVRLLGGEIGGKSRRSSDRSLEILRERFAKGEIDAEEFEDRKKSLSA